MIPPQTNPKKVKKSELLISLFLICSSLFGVLKTSNRPAFASPGSLQFQWDADPNFKILRSFQTSNQRMNAGTSYYFFLRPSDRKTGILKLTINVPSYFKTKLNSKKLNLCHVQYGGFTKRTKCLKDIPSVFEINETQTSIDIFPDNPIPVDKKTYAVVMKVRNPRKTGMFQFHGYAQSPGAMPISSYIGTWPFDVE